MCPRWRCALSASAAAGDRFEQMAGMKVQPAGGDRGLPGRLSRAIVACYNLWLSRSPSRLLLHMGFIGVKKKQKSGGNGFSWRWLPAPWGRKVSRRKVSQGSRLASRRIQGVRRVQPDR
ncbi:hypothetical protein Bxe_A1681 [Paraburkholderia xenovorans LB400]|uniref:Uncharacterized protein n=1 Tax=Paraburkholderia xenovorans (strain LB400) TaxID=266265 RepID=Q13XB5_PARXL|nr:hypothetical protein Bxe_A1681 [Paraburkholderia xenovorans LB400]